MFLCLNDYIEYRLGCIRQVIVGFQVLFDPVKRCFIGRIELGHGTRCQPCFLIVRQAKYGEKQFIYHIYEQVTLVLVEIEYRTSRLRDVLLQLSDGYGIPCALSHKAIALLQNVYPILPGLRS